MSLACLACHVLESSPERTLRSYSDNGGRCLGLGCWSRKIESHRSQIEPAVVASSITAAVAPTGHEESSRTRQQQVAPVPDTNAVLLGSSEAPGTPRLTRCHAVRRDLFSDWNFDEMSRQLCINLSGAA